MSASSCMLPRVNGVLMSYHLDGCSQQNNWVSRLCRNYYVLNFFTSPWSCTSKKAFSSCCT